MEGLQPFEPPNNLLLRLWLLPLVFEKSPPNPVRLEEAEKVFGAAYRKDARVLRFVTVSPNTLIPGVRTMAAVELGGKGHCVGLSGGLGVWTRQFQTQPLDWSKAKGEIIKGEYEHLAAAAVGNRLAVAVGDTAGNVKCLWANSVATLSASSAEDVLPHGTWKANQRVEGLRLSSSGQKLFLGVLVRQDEASIASTRERTGGGQTTLHVYCREGENNVPWREAFRVGLEGEVLDLSMLAHGNATLIAYLSSAGNQKTIRILSRP